MDEKEKTRTLVFDFYFVFRVSSIISLKLNDDTLKMDATVRKLSAESRAPRSFPRSPAWLDEKRSRGSMKLSWCGGT